MGPFKATGLILGQITAITTKVLSPIERVLDTTDKCLATLQPAAEDVCQLIADEQRAELTIKRKELDAKIAAFK